MWSCIGLDVLGGNSKMISPNQWDLFVSLGNIVLVPCLLWRIEVHSTCGWLLCKDLCDASLSLRPEFNLLFQRIVMIQYHWGHTHYRPSLYFQTTMSKEFNLILNTEVVWELLKMCFQPHAEGCLVTKLTLFTGPGIEPLAGLTAVKVSSQLTNSTPKAWTENPAVVPPLSLCCCLAYACLCPASAIPCFVCAALLHLVAGIALALIHSLYEWSCSLLFCSAFQICIVV